MRILDVGDDFFHRDGDRWLWDWYFPVEQSLRIWERYTPVDAYRFWGRIAPGPAPANEGKFPFPAIPKISVCGVRTRSGRGWKSYLSTFPSAVVRGVAAVWQADIVAFRWPSVFSMMLMPVALLLRRVVVIRLRVDAADLYNAAGKVNTRFFGIALARYTRWALRKADVPVCVSEFLRTKYGNERTRVFNECGVMSNQLVASSTDRHPIEGRILYVGRLTAEKGVSTLIDALAVLHRQGVPVSLAIVGDGPLRHSHQTRVAAAGLSDSVSFHGNVSERQKLYGFFDESSVFVLPSNSEGLGCVLLEAMARRVPIVATRVGGIPDLIRDGDTGLLVPPGDPEAMAAAIERMLRDDVLREQCICRGAELVPEHTFEKETGGWIDLAVAAWDKRARSGSEGRGTA